MSVVVDTDGDGSDEIENAARVSGPSANDFPWSTVFCLFCLPEEIQELVLDQLDVPDLKSCSQVCRLWREGVNKSRVWKKWCIVESYKRETLNEFSQNSINEEDHSSMNIWRLVYGWHAKLKSKWIMKSHSKYKLSIPMSSPLYCFDTDGTLVVTGHASGLIVVWSIKEKPRLVTKISSVLKDYPILSILLNKNFIVVLQKKLLQVYTIENERCRLTDLKCYEMGDQVVDLMNRYEELPNFSDWYAERCRARPQNGQQRIHGVLTFVLCEDLLFSSIPATREVTIFTVPRSEVQFVLHMTSELYRILKDDDSVYFVSWDQMTHLARYNPEMQSAEPLLAVPGHKEIIFGSQLVVAIPAPGDVTLKRIWAYKKGVYSKPLGTRTVSGHAISIFSPRCIAYAEMSTINIWDPFDSKNDRQFVVDGLVSCMTPAFFCFGLIVHFRALTLWDWRKGRKLYRVFNDLDWVGHYAKMFWANPTTILYGGADHQLEMLSFL